MAPRLVPTMAHGVEISLRELGPFRAQLMQKDGQTYHGTIFGLKRIGDEDDLIFVMVKDTTIPGVRSIDVPACALYGVNICGTNTEGTECSGSWPKGYVVDGDVCTGYK